jgi:hypothetical protein
MYAPDGFHPCALRTANSRSHRDLRADPGGGEGGGLLCPAQACLGKEVAMGQLPGRMQSLFPAVTVRSGLGAAQSPAGPDQAHGPLHRGLLDVAP